MSTVAQYSARAKSYVVNARHLLSTGEVEKAGECVWGAMAQALKARAAMASSPLRSHALLRKYAGSLADEMHRPELFQDFLAAEQMHTNFYEATLEREDVARVLERTALVVERLLRPRAAPA
ncbi:MAG: hypothetical protein HY330_01180 [Chloroflexi bacterium]|nr:hypothetical protein [Chloroflexota bacterium]